MDQQKSLNGRLLRSTEANKLNEFLLEEGTKLNQSGQTEYVSSRDEKPTKWKNLKAMLNCQ